MGLLMIVIGVVCGALSLWLIPHGYHILSKERGHSRQSGSSINAAVSGNDNVIAGDDVNITTTSELSSADRLRQKRESDPNVKIRMERNVGELFIRIRSGSHVASLGLDIPVLGKVISIHDYNSIVDVVTRSKKVVGANSDGSSNNIELLIENVKPGNELSYKVIFKPLPNDIFVAGTDRYKVSYTWQHDGNLFGKEEWISLQTGEVVEKPQVQVKGFNVINRALSAEEIKKLYEEGLKRSEVE